MNFVRKIFDFFRMENEKKEEKVQKSDTHALEGDLKTAGFDFYSPTYRPWEYKNHDSFYDSYNREIF